MSVSSNSGWVPDSTETEVGEGQGPVAEMWAFDRLPKLIRASLRETSYELTSTSVLAVWLERRAKGWSAKRLANHLHDIDVQTVAAAKAERGLP